MVTPLSEADARAGSVPCTSWRSTALQQERQDILEHGAGLGLASGQNQHSAALASRQTMRHETGSEHRQRCSYAGLA